MKTKKITASEFFEERFGHVPSSGSVYSAIEMIKFAEDYTKLYSACEGDRLAEVFARCFSKQPF